jgi:D-arabinose 1-dehydrogenase-like Zn-dependent alcohol dehydrogenase
LAAKIPVRTHVEEYSLEDANSALRRLKASAIQGAAALRIR